MRFVLTRDVAEFGERVGAFLAGRLECNVLATVLINVQDGFYAARSPVFGYGLDDDGEVCFAALRTPPWQLLTCGLEPSAAPGLIARWLEVDPDVPGVNGLPATARAVAAAWAEHTGGTTRCWMHEAMHALERVSDPPRPAAGELRLARDHERGQLVEWMRSFTLEARIDAPDRAEAMVDTRLARGGLLVWDDGRPVSVVGVTPAIAGVVRIGPVYTPPDQRRRGYAGSAVAAASRRALASGATRCMLFTDLENPTSNKIYAEVGYRRIADWEEHAFQVPADRDS